jgi:predicted O-methyltransferase YrrM
MSSKQFSSDWFSSNVPQWNSQKYLFDNLPNKRCLEIGSWEGRSTIYLAENYCNGAGSTVDAVDTWVGSIEHKEVPYNLLNIFKNNLEEHINNSRVIINQGKSYDILLKFNQEVQDGVREKYDFIYVDGSHAAKDVLSDAVLSWEMLNIGGLMFFDDYQWAPYTQKALCPKVAIDGFLNSLEGAYKSIHTGYQVHIQKTHESPRDLFLLGEQDSEL